MIVKWYVKNIATNTMLYEGFSKTGAFIALGKAEKVSLKMYIIK